MAPMLDLPVSPFLVPAQLSCASATAPASYNGGYRYNPAGFLSQQEDEQENRLEPVFCSPPTQSFQLLLRGGEDPVLKDELELPPPRRASTRLSGGGSGGGASPVSLKLSKLSTSGSSSSSSKRPKRASASGSASSSSLKSAVSALQQKKRPKRKASYLARKEEKEALLKHLDELQSQLNTLKYQAVVHGGSLRSQSQARKRLTKNILTDAVQKHQFAVAGLQAMLSKYSSLQEHSPIETTIRLGADVHARRETLRQLKEPKTHEARHFIAERSRGLDVTKTYSEEERFETLNGDFCVLRFDIIPIRGAKSVKQVFDVMLYYISNIEIQISETLGHITIREDDDSSDANISHHRLVTRIDDSIQSESNTVLFSEFVEKKIKGGGRAGSRLDDNDDNEGADRYGGDDDNEEIGVGGDGFGIIAGDFIDEDELYPYRPLERVRRDVSAMMTVTPHLVKTKKKKTQQTTFGQALMTDNSGRETTDEDDEDLEDGENEEEEEELIVVLKRWSLAKLHKPDLPISTLKLQEIRDNYGRWNDEILKSMRVYFANANVNASANANGGGNSQQPEQFGFASPSGI